MTGTAVVLCNQALRLLGEGQIASLDEGTELANTCNTLWQDTARALLASYPWRFTLRKARLARLEEAPLAEWRHAHALPPDLLTLRELFASETARLAVRAYERFESRVLSNQPDLWADYQVEKDPGEWPPAFILLARYALAAEFAVPVAGSLSAAEYWDRKAYGTPMENRAGGQMAVARRLDAQQQPPQVISDFPLIAARMGGSGQPGSGGRPAAPAPGGFILDEGTLA